MWNLLKSLLVLPILMGVAFSGQNSESDCGKCHQEKLDSRSSHFIESGDDCIFCHETGQTLELSGQHTTVTVSGNELCQSCHTSRGIAVSSKEHEILECVDCHNPHGSNQENNLNSPVISLCTGSCHSNHELGRSHPIGAGVVDPNTRTEMTCVSTCHTVHNSEANGKLLQLAAIDLCYSCHNTKF
ncbi:MAG: cytochrome c3 family protein [candidate division Zixibacteria bacterium]